MIMILRHYSVYSSRRFQPIITTRTTSTMRSRGDNRTLFLRRCHEGLVHERFIFSLNNKTVVAAVADRRHHQVRAYSSASSSHFLETDKLPKEEVEVEEENLISVIDSSSAVSSSRLVLLKENEELWTLYQRPVGTLSPDEWLLLRLAFIEAGKTMTALRRQKQGGGGGGEGEGYSTTTTTSKALIDMLEHGFALLDRMAAERQVHIHIHGNDNAAAAAAAVAESTASRMLSGRQDFPLPVVDRPWVLFLWRNIMMMQQQQQRHAVHSTTITLPSLPLVVDKLSTYLQLGLLPWTNESMTYVLDVVKCNAHPARAPMVAMDILKRLEQASSAAAASAAEKTANVVAVAATMSAKDTAYSPPPARLCCPRNTILTTHLVGLWIKSRHPNAPLEAMNLLQEAKNTFRILQQQRQDDDDDDIGQHHLNLRHDDDYDLDSYRPDAQLYASVMHAWAKSSPLSSSSSYTSNTTTIAPQQVLDLLLEAQRDYDIQPTTLLYNNVIHAITHQVGRRWGTNSNNRERNLHLLREAKNVLEGMIAKYRQQGDQQQTTSVIQKVMSPTAASYSSILAAYMRVGQLHKALELLHEMKNLARLNDAPEMAPSDFCFQTCLGRLQECIKEHNFDHQQQHDEQDFQQAAAYLQSLYRKSSSVSVIDMTQILPTLDRLCLQVAMSPALLDDLHHCDLLLHDEKISIISSLVDLALQTWNKRQTQQQQRKERRGGQVDARRGILKRLVHYQQMGLLQPTNATLNWMISSLESTTTREIDASSSSSSSSVALQAQEMIEMARQACRYNVHDTLYHPNQIPMTRLVQLWTKTTAATTTETNHGSSKTGSHQSHHQQQQQRQQPSYYTAPHHAAEATLALLKDWYHETNQRMDMKPDVPIYTAVVRALVRHGPDKDQVAQRAMELLQECNSFNDGQKPSDTRSHDHALEELYSSVLNALVQSSLVEQGHAFFLNLLGTYVSSTKVITPDKSVAAMATIAAAAAKIKMTATTVTEQQPLLQPTSMLRPTPVMISSLVSGYTRQKRPDLADGFLRTMEKLYQETGDKVFLPNTICYNTLNIGYTKVRQPEKAEATLERMLHSWNNMLVAWTKSHSPDAADRATAILGQLEQLRKESSSPSGDVTTTTGGGPSPDVISYNCVLECYWRNPQAHRYARAAEQLLESMETSDNVRPNANSYLLCLFVMRKAALGEQSIAILERYCRLYFEGKIIPDEGPDTRHFNAVIGAFGRTSSSDAFDKAVGVVKVMMNLHTQNQGLKANPDQETFESLLQCALNSGKKDEIPEKAETVLGLMHQQLKRDLDESVKPDAEMYSKIISAWGNSNRQDAHRRLDVLLEQMQLSQIQPNRHCFANSIAAYRKHGCPEKAQAQFDAMVKAGSDDNGGGGSRSSSSESSLRPNFPNYVTLLEAWADVGQAARASIILEQLLAENAAGRIKGLPNTRHFSSVIQAWTNSPRPDAAEQAENLLNKMEHLSLPTASSTSKKKYPCRPNADTYASVISAHAKSGKSCAAERAEKLLKRLEAIYNETGDEKCRPNLAVYSEALRAHVAVVSPTDNTTLMRVNELLDDMRSLPDSAWQNQGKAVRAKLMESIQKSQIPEKDCLVSSVEDITRERLGPDH